MNLSPSFSFSLIGIEYMLSKELLRRLALLFHYASFLVHVLFLLVKFVDLDDYSP